MPAMRAWGTRGRGAPMTVVAAIIGVCYTALLVYYFYILMKGDS